MSARQESGRIVPPLPVRTSEQLKASFRTSELSSAACEALRQSERDAAELLNEAVRDAQLTRQEVAHLCGVSESLVDKWCNPDQRGAPSFVQMLLLPPRFHWALHKAMNRRARFAFARRALLDLLEAAGTLALGID